MDDLKNFCCQNKNCPKYGIRGEENITVRAVYGKNNTRLPKDKVVSILEHVAEGNGMRKTGRLTKVGHVTVSRYTKLADEPSEQLHDELVAFSPEDRRNHVIVLRKSWSMRRCIKHDGKVE